jgi:hypothetical protein
MKSTVIAPRTGSLVDVFLPFERLDYEKGYNHVWVSQGGYTVIDLARDQNKIVVAGPACPCLIIVLYDAEKKKLLVFHKHYTNSIEHIGVIIQENFWNSKPQALYARVFSVLDADHWKEENLSRLHGGLTHQEEMDRVCNFLHEKIAVPREHIVQDLYTLHPFEIVNPEVGDYQDMAVYVAVKGSQVLSGRVGREQIRLFSVSPYLIDCLNLFGNLWPQVLCTLNREKLQGQYWELMAKRLTGLYLKNFHQCVAQYICSCGSKYYDAMPFYSID